MGHGGARDNSGRKGIYGDGIKTKAVRVPEVVPIEVIRKASEEYLKKLEQGLDKDSSD